MALLLQSGADHHLPQCSRVEESWQERAFTARMLTRDGDEVKVAATKAQPATWS